MAIIPIEFSAFIGWVDATDPNNIPAEVRIISASDLLRYETFGQQAAAKINLIEPLVESHGLSLTDHTTSLTELETLTAEHTLTLADLPGLATGLSTAQTDITALEELRTPVVTKTAAYTTVITDHIVVGNAAGPITITLMSPVTAGNGKEVRVKNMSTATLTVASVDGKFDGVNGTYPLARWDYRTFVSDGVTWLEL